MKGYLAISRGLLAIGAGDLRHRAHIGRRCGEAFARRSADAVAVGAIGADGRRPRHRRAAIPRHGPARRHKLLGLRGLYIEAQRRGDAQAARRVASEAAKAQPSLAWAGQAALDD
ncbi:MAG: heme biosynthesis protein HemY, partial [Pseudolabrys sp.]